MTLLEAITLRLRASSAITSQLGDGTGAQSILLLGRLKQGVSDATPLPCLALEEGEWNARPRHLPFGKQYVNLYVYDVNPGAGVISYRKIDQILQECIETLHRAPLVTAPSYYGVLEVQYDNYLSGNKWDDMLKLPYKIGRFCAYTVRYRY